MGLPRLHHQHYPWVPHSSRAGSRLQKMESLGWVIFLKSHLGSDQEGKWTKTIFPQGRARRLENNKPGNCSSKERHPCAEHNHTVPACQGFLRTKGSPLCVPSTTVCFPYGSFPVAVLPCSEMSYGRRMADNMSVLAQGSLPQEAIHTIQWIGLSFTPRS